MNMCFLFQIAVLKVYKTNIKIQHSHHQNLVYHFSSSQSELSCYSLTSLPHYFQKLSNFSGIILCFKVSAFPLFWRLTICAGPPLMQEFLEHTLLTAVDGQGSTIHLSCTAVWPAVGCSVKRCCAWEL